MDGKWKTWHIVLLAIAQLVIYVPYTWAKRAIAALRGKP